MTASLLVTGALLTLALTGCGSSGNSKLFDKAAAPAPTTSIGGTIPTSQSAPASPSPDAGEGAGASDTQTDAGEGAGVADTQIEDDFSSSPNDAGTAGSGSDDPVNDGLAEAQTAGVGGAGGLLADVDGDAGAGGGPVAVEPEAPPACDGAEYAGICWYLGDRGASCNETCAGHQGHSPDAAGYVGTEEQGGSQEACQQILSALDITGVVQAGTRQDGIGAGCHLFGQRGDPWWLSSPDFDPDASLRNARLVCGCQG